MRTQFDASNLEENKIKEVENFKADKYSISSCKTWEIFAALKEKVVLFSNMLDWHNITIQTSHDIIDFHFLHKKSIIKSQETEAQNFCFLFNEKNKVKKLPWPRA